MSSFIGLDESSIKKHLNNNPCYDFYIFQEIDSTNLYLKDLPPSLTPAVCIAESQTQGRGRFGREWISPFGENIYLSLRWPLSDHPTKLAGLSLAIGISILESLKGLGVREEILIKWPNDLLWKEKKLCGILIELHANQLIIGIGLNVNVKPENAYWCSLLDISNKNWDRNTIIAAMLRDLSDNIRVFFEYGFDFFRSRWENYDYLKNKIISIKQGEKIIEGRVSGINLSGELGLEQQSGSIEYLSAGETTLKGSS
jgi:BirA family biotin operon repressor/biotin-[acetyl-CoA-carboxylase] ligase